MIEKDDLFITTTDTLIGIGSKINENNLKKIYEIKNRPLNKKIIILIGSIEQLKKIETIDEVSQEYINQYWPGPTTLIINGNSYRMPDNQDLLALTIKEGPFYLTSANISGSKPCKTIEEAKKIFPTINKIYNFGYGSNIPSTIIDVKTGKKVR